MELKEFTKKVIKDLIDAVEETRTESKRDLHMAASKESRTVEFDLAVTIENESIKSGSGGIKVWGVGAEGSAEGKSKNSTVNHVKFGVNINEMTKEEEKQSDLALQKVQRDLMNQDPYAY